MNILPWHIAVLIPARNEEKLLPRCLDSVLAAASSVARFGTVDIILAVDSSSDRTAQVGHQIIRGRGITIRTTVGIVGRVRALAAGIALKRYSGSRSRCWLANTDADSAVPRSWLSSQISLALEGVEAIAGTIDIDSFEEHGPLVRERFHNAYVIRPDGSHSHVHGANFGVRADAYLKAGGWGDISCGEDHDLWRRLVKVGARRVSVDRIRVVTSGRRKGRAPHGFAEALAAHNETAA